MITMVRTVTVTITMVWMLSFCINTSAFVIETVMARTMCRGTTSTKLNTNTNTNTALYVSKNTNDELVEMSIEDIVKSVRGEQDQQKIAAKREDVKQKKETTKRKADKIYDNYWQKQEKQTKAIKQGDRKMTEQLYYSLGKEETLGQKLAKPRSSSKAVAGSLESSDDTSMYIDETSNDEEVSNKDLFLLAGSVILSLFASVYIAQNLHLYNYSPEIDDGWYLRL